MTTAELEWELEDAAEAMASPASPPPPPPGAYQTTPQLMRGNLGERLATEALAALGHQILMYKPDITGTSRPGIDAVTFHNGQVWLVDNKAFSRGGNIYSVSALTRNLNRNVATVGAQLAVMAGDANRTPAERQLAQQALEQLRAGNYVRAVTNANVARQNNVPKGVDSRLQKQGIRFVDLFRSAAQPAPATPFRARTPTRRRARSQREGEWASTKRMNTTPILQVEFEAELETAATQQEVEQMEPGLGHAIGQAWQNLPQTTKEWIKVQLRLALQDTLQGRPQDVVRRTIAILLPQLYPTALQMAIETQSAAHLQARIRQLVRSTPIPPAVLERRKGMTREQTRQYERRQRARGGTPGRNRALGRGRWRESEIDSATTALEFELAVPSGRAGDLEIASAELANELAADESGAEQTEQESVGTISSSDYLKWVQRSLNRLYGIRIPTDGAISASYREAVRKFNQDYTGRDYDGVDEQTQNQIIYANEGTGGYVAWLIHALNAAGVGPVAITETYTPGVVAAIKKFQARPGLGIKADGYVGSKTELALVNASGLLPPGEVKKKPVPRRFDRRKLAKKLLDLSGEISRSGGNTIREKRILCMIRLLTSHLVDGERIDDCFVDSSPPFGKLRCRERVLTRLSRRNLDESSARFRKGIFDLYEEIKRPLERTKLALIKISFDTTEDALVNTPECTFVRFFKKKAGDPKSIYRCFAAYIASFGSQCDLP